MTKYLPLIASLLLSANSFASTKLANDKDKVLTNNYLDHHLYGYDFSTVQQLNDWHIEGFGLAKIANQQLILEPEFHQQMMVQYEQGKFSNKNSALEYGSNLASLVSAKYPEQVKELYFDGIFRGGHFNFWNKNITPENYAISFDFKSLSSQALHMLMFSAQGLNGQDVLSGGLKTRVGLAQEIMFGDLQQYRISYFFPWRKTANMRKAPGRNMTSKGKDYASEEAQQTHHMVITKYQGKINYFVNGQHALYFSDKQPYAGGNWGFRLMVLAKGAYDNINIYQLKQDPIITNKSR